MAIEEKHRTPEEIEKEWLEKVYRPDVPQLTFRAVVMGMFLGCIMSLSNLYVGLKTGWGLGVAITACILSYALWTTGRKIFPSILKSDMTILENNCMQSTATSAGVSVGGALVSAQSALLMITGHHLPFWTLMNWTLLLAVLGVMMAIPMKRQMINIEQLKFPSGIATAETLRSLHASGIESMKKARALFISGAFGIVIAWARDGVIGFPLFKKIGGVMQWKKLLPSLPTYLHQPVFLAVKGFTWEAITIKFELSAIMIAAGAIIGMRTASSMMIGGILNYGILVPPLMEKGIIYHNPPTLEGKGIAFPLTIPAKSIMSVSVSHGKDRKSFSMEWKEAAIYNNPKELLDTINSKMDGEKNGFVRFGLSRDLLSGDKISFPVKIEKGSSISLTIQHKRPVARPANFEGKEIRQIEDNGSTKNIEFIWQKSKSYNNIDNIVSDLNAEKMEDGSANPLSGLVRLREDKENKGRLMVGALSRGDLIILNNNSVSSLLGFSEGINSSGYSLLVIAPRAIARDSSLSIENPIPALGFKKKVSDSQNAGGYRNIVSWSLWFGAALMVASGLLAFAFQWKTILRAFSDFTKFFSKVEAKTTDVLASIEVPGSWFILGTFLSGLGLIWMEMSVFGIPYWMGTLAVIMAFFLSIVACRATGETDITPIGAMGKITQLFYGVVSPSNMTTNLMTACVTAGAAGSAADLLTDLKSGYVLGANPRKQFIAQFLGIFAGGAIIVPAFYLVVPTPDILGSDKFPAPAAQVWKGVAELLSNGLSSLELSARYGIVFGIITGIVLTVLEKIFPKWRKWIPSSMGLGLAFVIPFYNCLSMFLGAFIVYILEKVNKPLSDTYTIPVASGIIAGESLMGIAVAILIAGNLM